MTASRESPLPGPRRVLNLKALAICLIVVLAVSIGMRRMHRQQVRKTVAYLEEQADEAIRHRSAQEAVEALERFLAFDRVDRAACHRLSRMLSKHATNDEMLSAAYVMNQSMLLDERQNAELRLRQTELAIQLRYFSDADFHLRVLRETLRDNPRVWHLSGLVAEHGGHSDDAIDCYREAIQLNSVDGQTYTRLAELLTETGANPAEVEPLFESLIRHHRCGESFQAKAAWLLTQNRTDDAIAELWTGLSLAPDDVRLNSTLAAAIQLNPIDDPVDRQQQQSRLLQHLRTQMTQHPTVSRLPLICASLLWDSGRRQDALSILRTGISRSPDAVELQEVLIDYLVTAGDAEQAEAAFDNLPRSAVDRARWHFLLGRVHMAAQRWSRAAQAFEQAGGCSGADERVRHQSEACLALCREELGEHTGGIDAWRTTVQSRPESTDHQLQRAAAWLKSDRIDLAIKEYRKLRDRDGVPELLASLLIRDTVRRPRAAANWQVLEILLRDHNPVISDETQRLLLQADMLFARGCPARAIRALDAAAARQPTNTLIRSARRRVLEDREGALLQHLMRTLKQDPDHVETHAAVLRLQFHHSGCQEAVHWLRQLIDGRVCHRLPVQCRLALAAQVAETVATDFERIQELAAAATMLAEAEQAWDELTETSAELHPDAIAFLARHRDEQALLAALGNLPTGSDPLQLARCWLAALENTGQINQLRTAVELTLRQLVAGEPSDLRLRQTYVEYLVHFARYPAALSIQREILQHDPHSIEGLSRCAWILTMTDGDHAEALALSETAARSAPMDAGVRIVRALVLASSSAPADALPVFDAIPEEARTPESVVYEALALLRVGQHDEARRLTEDMLLENEFDRWRPADRALLDEVRLRSRSAAVVVDD